MKPTSGTLKMFFLKEIVAPFGPASNFSIPVNSSGVPSFRLLGKYIFPFLGVINLLQLHLNKISRKKENWKFSTLTLSGFMIMMIFAFVYKGVNGEEFIDGLNGQYDDGEKFIDINGNNIYDHGEDFTDTLNGIYDRPELFTDLNGNDQWETTIDQSQSSYYGHWWPRKTLRTNH